MLGQHDVGLREPVEQSVVNHVLRAARELLGGLNTASTVPDHSPAVPCEHGGGADQAGRVHVVAAGVHHRGLAPATVGGAISAGVGQSGLLLNR